jgi:hypothetical protein
VDFIAKLAWVSHIFWASGADFGGLFRLNFVPDGDHFGYLSPHFRHSRYFRAGWFGSLWSFSLSLDGRNGTNAQLQDQMVPAGTLAVGSNS